MRENGPEQLGQSTGLARRPSVIIAVQPTTGGVAVHTLQLVNRLSHEFDVRVLAPDDQAFRSQVAESGGTWEALNVKRSPSLREISEIFRLRSAFEQADAVILESSKAGALGRLALMMIRKSRRPKSSFTPHGWSWLVGGPLRPFYILIEYLLQRATDVVVAVSSADAIEGRRYLRRATIQVIVNGVDPRGFVAPAIGEARQEAEVLVVGRLSRSKGQDIAVGALARMKNELATLVLVGDGEERNRLLELCSELGVADRVRMVGNVDPRPYYRSAAIMLVPSRWDACSLVTLEALAAGAAVLVSDRVGVHGELSGYVEVLPALDRQKVADAIDSLLASPEHLFSLRRRASSSISGGLVLDNSLQKHLTLVRNLASVDSPAVSVREPDAG